MTNPAQLLYSDAPEPLPASDAAALVNRLGVLPDSIRDWCGDVVDMLQVCSCGLYIVKPAQTCEACRTVPILRSTHMARPRKTAEQPPADKLPQSIEQLRRSVNYDEAKATEMQRQAEELERWVKSPQVRSTQRIRESIF